MKGIEKEETRVSRGSAFWSTSTGYSLIGYIFVNISVYNVLDDFNVFKEALSIVEY
jgi:hypothetical protein